MNDSSFLRKGRCFKKYSFVGDLTENGRLQGQKQRSWRGIAGSAFPQASRRWLVGKTNADGTTTGTPTLGPYWQYIPNNTAVVDPTQQNLVKVMTANPTANDAVFGWIYNKANGIFYSAADYTK